MTPNDTQAGAAKIRAGAGTLIGSNPLGFYISNPNSGMSFNHPFKPVLVGAGKGAGLRFSKGVVDGFEPQIGGKPMSSSLLALTGEITSATHESWAVLEATPNDKGVLDKDSPLKIVHGLAPGGMIGGTVARQAIALIVWRDKNPVMVWPLVFFNLRYARKVSASAPTRHFFL